MIQTPTVFVGSSSEGMHIAEAVQNALNKVADVTIWDQGPFELNYSYLDSLLKVTEKADFAVLVLTPDDAMQSRDAHCQAPRDNVIFELGLFMGRLGRDRCFFLYDQTRSPKLPSDLLGISSATYRPHADGNHQAAVGVACNRIKQRIRELGRRPRLLNSYLMSPRLAAADGAWTGVAHQDLGPDGVPIDAELVVTLDARNPQITGIGSFRFARTSGESLGAQYRLNGGFLFDQFLRIEYDNVDPHRIQFGSIILELAPNAEVMQGRYQGYGMESKQIVHGTIVLHRTGSPSSLSSASLVTPAPNPPPPSP